MDHKMNVDQHGVHVTTTVPSGSGGGGGGFRDRIKSSLYLSYLRTPPGILKIAQLVLSLIGLICTAIAAYPNWRPGEFYDFTAATAATITFILLVFYVVRLVMLIERVPWYLVEGVYCIVFAILYLIASSLLASFATAKAALGAGSFFGFCAMVVYACDGVLKIKNHRAGKRPADTVVVQHHYETDGAGGSPPYSPHAVPA